jgi:hypothetical protein
MRSAALTVAGVLEAGGAQLPRFEAHAAYEGSDDVLLLDHEMYAMSLGDTLRTNVTLTRLTLTGIGLGQANNRSAVLLTLLYHHPCLRVLDVSFNNMTVVTAAVRAAFGLALAGLLGCKLSALTALDVSHCELGDADVACMFDLLRVDSHLEMLRCGGNLLSDAFLRGQLPDGVRANTTLHCIDCHHADEAVPLVRSRS